MTMNSGSAFGDSSGATCDNPDVAQQGDAMGTADTSGGNSGSNNIEQARQQVGDVAQQVKGAASQATTAAADATRRTAAQAKDAAAELVEQAKGQAKQLTQQFTQQVTDQGANMFNEQKSRAAASLGGIGNALRCAAERLHEEQDKNLAGYADSLADGLESTASYLRDSDLRRLMNDAGDFARRRPEWVLGGAFIAGLALVRFLKASRSDTNDSQSDVTGYGSQMDYATSDQYMDDDEASIDEIARHYRVGAHPGMGGTASDAGPDMDVNTTGRNFAGTDAARNDAGPDAVVSTPDVAPEAIGSAGDVGTNPDERSDNPNNRTNASTDATL